MSAASKLAPDAVEAMALPELEALRVRLVADLETVQMQLSQKDKRHPDGRRWTSHEYHDWRGRAVYARAKIVEVLRAVNARMKMLNREAAVRPVPAEITDPTDPRQVLSALYQMVRGLCRDGVELDEPEQALMDLARNCIVNGKAVSP